MNTKPVKKLEREERREKVAELLMAGHTYRQIAKTLFVSVGTVQKDVDTILEELKAKTTSVAHRYRDLELRRLDRLQSGFWIKAITGEETAATVILRIMERRAKLLGLDSPSKIDLRQIDDETLIRLISELEDESTEEAESAGP
jgi:DNA-binding CsgD family transcriptional regulator